jgi:AraC family transcriptional regulator of adaptative response/methylated-DNA-[protein]-cysteine methyltransferase
VGSPLSYGQNARMNDYERIARVIRYVDAHHTEQPNLTLLAQEAGLSESRFHRLFTAWAGVTPKSFLQCLTFSRARGLLRAGENILDAALDAGLSGPGRLHDLCVSLEAASPGEIKSGGAGWRMTAGFGPTPFGDGLAAQSPRGVCHISFVDSNRESAWEELTQSWPNARWRRNDTAACALLAGIFDGADRPLSRQPLRALVKGTDFQVRVWRALLRVPPGGLTTYGRLAAAIGAPSAARAVGSAVAGNDLAWLIPCHRVIRQTGAAGEYRWGAARKRAMIAWEDVTVRPEFHSPA